MGADMKEEKAAGFEGFEKRLEVEFEEYAYNYRDANCSAGLMSLTRCELDEMLVAAECTIVSELHNKWFDAYVLSESSLFVYPRRIILKTCGRTQLLNAIPVLLRHATALSLQPVRCKYSRGSFIFPHAQPFPYTSFTEETRVLDELFSPMLVHGCRSAHVLDGHRNLDSSSWHIYTATAANEYVPAPSTQASRSTAMAGGNCVKTSSNTAMAAGDDSKTSLNMFMTAGECVKTFPDIAAAAAGDRIKNSLSSPGQSPSSMYTLEMCMTHLHPSTASHFMNLSGIKSGADMTHDSGISLLLPNAVICDYAFTPCGYSMNGMEEEALSTIHITPEEGHSYASFEVMGYDPKSLDLGALVNRVVACFKPGSLVMSIHASGYGKGRLERTSSSWDSSNVVPQGYVCNSSVRQELVGDAVVAFHTFTESPSAGECSVIPQPLCGHNDRADEWDIDRACFNPEELSAAFRDVDGDDDGFMMPWLQQHGRGNTLLDLDDTTLEMVAADNYIAQAKLTCSYDEYAGNACDVAYAHEGLEIHGRLSNDCELIDHCGALLTIVDSELELFQLQECYPNAKVIIRLRPKSKGYHTEPSPNIEELLRKSKKLGLQVIGIAVDMGTESTRPSLCAYKGAAIKICGRAQALGMPPLKLLAMGHCSSANLACD